MTTGSRSTHATPITPLAEASIAEVERAVREADPLAFPVAPRVVRRVIRDQVDLPGLAARVPHRKSFVLSGARVRPTVMNDELGIDADAALPETVILLARPEEDELEQMTEWSLRRHYHRLHFHSRIHLALDSSQAGRLIDEQTIARRIAQIGGTAFEEIRTVLRQEAFLLHPLDDTSVYVEFVAVFLELRYFEPDLLPIYFPSLDDVTRVEAVVTQDVDPHPLLAMSAEFAGDTATADFESGTLHVASAEFISPERALNARILSRARRGATTAAEKGNDVRSAILHMRIATGSDRGFAKKNADLADDAIERLVRRLQQALSLDGETTETWRQLLKMILPQASYGFWNSSARLLYDVQKVCLDFERTTFVVDLGAWLRSFGRQQLKRALPAQREVRMSKHLRSALKRLPHVQIPEGYREQFSTLLQDATSVAEEKLRERLRPTIETTMHEVGFCPQNIPERVAFRKIVEELLDAVVVRGFIGMGDLRDAIARNELKLADVADPKELIVGDRLLCADRRLAAVLDGVYVRGAFYLRWLQRLSSLAFGTRTGRFITLNAVIPFGGAFLLLAGLDHLIHAVNRLIDGAPPAPPPSIVTLPPHETHSPQAVLATVPLVLLVGTFFLALMRNAKLRGMVWNGLRAPWRGLRSLVVEFPKWIAKVTFVNQFLQSAPVVFFRKRLLTSLLLTLLVSAVLPMIGLYEPPTKMVTAAAFIMFAVVLNSRAGRDIEELAAERLHLLWYRIRVHVFVALFDLIMDSFKQVLEWLERILYEVDEWLRFQSGETRLTLAVKAVLGLMWAIARFFLRFMVTVLVEPQINPIKHFPVVTVSHKMIIWTIPSLGKSLEPFLGPVRGLTTATTIVFLIPGAFGFLVWELRANWRLYAVNRHRKLTPSPVGRHGETMLRLIKPGIHSGTLPKLFTRMRRQTRRTHPSRRMTNLMSYHTKWRRVEVDVRRFFEREFLNYLAESKAFHGVSTAIGDIELGTNSLRVEIEAPILGNKSLWITIEQQAGRLISGIWRPGWIAELSDERRTVLAGLLVGFYRVCGVDVVREQLHALLAPHQLEFEVTEAGLLIQPETDPTTQDSRSELHSPLTIPWREMPSPALPGHLSPAALVFRRTSTLWNDWTSAWSQEENAQPFPNLPPLEPTAVTLPAGLGGGKPVLTLRQRFNGA